MAEKPERTFRLLAFDATDAEYEDGRHFTVQMFAINELGKTASINVTGFQPFFYVKVTDAWKEGDTSVFRETMPKKTRVEPQSVELVKHKKLYGFDGGKLHKFLQLKFNTEDEMRWAKRMWYNSNGLLQPFKCNGHDTELYEAQSTLPPLLRLFHLQEVSPSGWVYLEKPAKVADRKTTCHYEYVVKWTDIKPLPEKETAAPFKICSFDIEASSSHGDFPLPVKTYKKLAANIVDWSERVNPEDIDDNLMSKIILTGFGYQGMDDVDLVYPQKPMSEDDVETKTQDLLAAQVDKFKNATSNTDADAFDAHIQDNDAGEGGDEDKDSDDEGGAGENDVLEPGQSFFRWRKPVAPVPRYVKKGTILDVLRDETASRETKLKEVQLMLDHFFPPLQGDKVTFIGSSFMINGQVRPYLQHCLVQGTCSPVPNSDIKIESRATEKDLLLAWTELIQNENPDIIIGYNIFGFDYNFMYLRAKELNIERPFLRLSRNKNHVCLSKDMHTKKEGLESFTVVLASGQFDMKYVKMPGRLQIDMYNYLRREYQLSQYKLDYVAGHFIGDYVKTLDTKTQPRHTVITTKNMTGLDIGSYVSFEVEHHSTDPYNDGEKYMVTAIDRASSAFVIAGEIAPDMTKLVRWGLAKDDVTPQDIFRMTNEGPDERAVIAKYCIQDCNLVLNLLRKIDVITGYIEMANLCSVPMDFLVFRGQGIKLMSYVAKKCREKNTLMPVINKTLDDDGYEGATVLEPKCDLYLDDPVACVDYSSLYPSSMMSENISHDSKVWTKEYNLRDQLVAVHGECNAAGQFIYDHLPGYEYVDITYNVYKWQLKNPSNPKSGKIKVKVGYKVCRFAQFPDDPVTGATGRAIMPAILQELLAARKATRKQGEAHPDEFMRNVLDKRQLSIKVTANSLYGQTGARTSAFYDKDCAASTTAMGRKFLTYGKRVIEEAYKDRIVTTKEHGDVRTNAEYVYGDTDSVFFKFNLTDPETGAKITGSKALAITIELAQQAGELASHFLKYPHDLEYEKTFLPFCLLSKKRYVGVLYEHNPKKGKTKFMGIVLKRRDNAPIVKDIYGGVIDILMKNETDDSVDRAARFVRRSLQDLVDEKVPIEKLMITKALRGNYKNPQQIAHKVLADRMGKRDAGNKPSVGDRIPFVFIENENKRALQGDRIETPDYILANKLKINYAFYITNQIMKPLQQVFGLVLEQIGDFRKRSDIGKTLTGWHKQMRMLKEKCDDEVSLRKETEKLRNKYVKMVIFDPFLLKHENAKNGQRELTDMFALATTPLSNVAKKVRKA
jgi:DNA polymerase elongation subunit (family B)